MKGNDLSEDRIRFLKSNPALINAQIAYGHKYGIMHTEFYEDEIWLDNETMAGALDNPHNNDLRFGNRLNRYMHKVFEIIKGDKLDTNDLELICSTLNVGVKEENDNGQILTPFEIRLVGNLHNLTNLSSNIPLDKTYEANNVRVGKYGWGHGILFDLKHKKF